MIRFLLPLLLTGAPAHATKPAKAPKEIAPPKGLKGVVKLDRAQGLTQEAHAVLERDGVVVVRGLEPQFFHLYDDNAYHGIPSLITADTLLHLFHLRFDTLLQRTELSTGVAAVKALAQGQYTRALALWPAQGEPSPRVRRLTRTHAVALALIDAESIIDPRIDHEVQEELAKIRRADGLAPSATCGGSLDYTRFKPRGHYDVYALHPYFQALTFYALCAHDLSKPEALEAATDELRLLDAPALAQVATLRELGRFVAGRSEDPGPEELAKLLPPSLPAMPAPLAPPVLQALQAPAVELGPRRMAGDIDMGRAPAMFSLVPPSATEDSMVLRMRFNAVRKATVLAVLAALDSKDALKELGLTEMFQLGTGGDGVAARWLDLLRVYLAPPDPRAPPFTRSPTWSHRVLVGASASWVEMRHDTLLYTKQPLVMMEGGHDAELPAQDAAGYVEPVPALYRAIDAQLEQFRPRLTLPADLAALDALKELVGFLVKVSELELAGAPFPRDVDERIKHIGPELEALTRGHADKLPDQELITDVVGTAQASQGPVLSHEVAVGRVDEVWAVVPRGGKWLLTRGGVFSYYEFDSKERLTDREWTDLLRTHTAPVPPAWAKPMDAAPIKPPKPAPKK